MNPTTPAVSVLMPVFNGERFLAEAIESILGQTFTDFEFVIVDDGSTDASPAILAKYASRDPRIRVLRQTNAGIVAALNRGLAECRGPLVARMDADDVSAPSRLAAQTKYLNDHPDIAVVGTTVRLIAESGRRGPVLCLPMAPDAVRRALQRGTSLAHPTTVMRKDTVIAAGGYREELRHAEDYDLWSRLAIQHRLANIQQPLLFYRIHGSQVSWLYSELQAIRTIAVPILAEERQSQGADSIDRGSDADIQFIRDHGVAEGALRRAVVDSITGRAKLCGLVGMTQAIQDIERQLSDHPPRDLDEQTRALIRTRLMWAYFLAHCHNTQIFRAALAAARCGLGLLGNPGEILRIARARALAS